MLEPAKERASRKRLNLNALRDSISALNTKLFSLKQSRQERKRRRPEALGKDPATVPRQCAGKQTVYLGFHHLGGCSPKPAAFFSTEDATLGGGPTGRIRSLRELQGPGKVNSTSISPAGLVINRLKRHYAGRAELPQVP